MSASTEEQGPPTVWDAGWREGYAKALQVTLGIPYKAAWFRARDFWSPRPGWRLRLARWLLRAGQDG